MKFLIITHTAHKKVDEQLFAYEPYVREMNLWTKYASDTRVVAPVLDEAPRSIDSAYQSKQLTPVSIPQINFTSLSKAVGSLFKIPVILFRIIQQCFWADHIHLRCPGNIGLLGCFVQIFFPSKIKTAKYAGNWDPKSAQPKSYRIQKNILSNTFLTRNCKVLVYGHWEGATKNIYPFFTASYRSHEIENVQKVDLSDKIKLIFVGALTVGKQPILSVKAAEKLRQKGYPVELNIYGDGMQYHFLKDYIDQNQLTDFIFLHGNQEKSVVKKAFQDSHFLVFISKSEGWPKVVAEAMFWSCIPIASRVSCVPYMLGEGERGTLVNESIEEIVDCVKSYVENKEVYFNTVEKGKTWSQEITLDTFEKEISKLIK